MSKVPKSPSHSRSRSGSRSRSRSFSRSRTRSRSRSRSRKHRYSSRSRSRSRSHSPGQHRDRNYPREYQNNREFRGYHRGFRRPYYYRGRGRGYFPRGRYQRGGGYNNNYRPNNWQNYRQHPQQQAPHHQHSPRRGRSRSRTPKKRSGSPRSRSRSRYSDRSSSGRSRRSSSSSSRSSSPRRRSGSGSAKRNAKDVKDRSASKEAQRGVGGDEELEQEAGGGGGGEADEEVGASEKGASNWQGLTDYNSSPKKASPQVRSAVIVGQGPVGGSSQPSPSPKGSAASGNSATAWQSTGATPSNKSPVEKSPSTMITGFGFFSKEEHRAGEKAAISTAFKKFLEEHKSKKQACDWENGRDKDVSADAEREKGADKCGAVFERGPVYGSSKGPDHSTKGDKDKYKYGDRFEGDVASGAYMKGPLFLCADAEEDGEDVVEPRPKARKDREPEDEPRPKGKATLSAQELFEERFGKWDDVSYFPTSKERARKEAEPAPGDELDSTDVELYRSRKERASALAKKEVYRGFSPEKPAKARKRERAESSPTPPPHVTSDTREREMFMVHKDNSPPRASGKRGAELSVRMDPLWDELASASGTLADERRISRDLVHPTKKEKEFRSIFQHIQATQLRRSPSELFAQHIVTIVHHIKAQHFPSSGMTLNERFAMYQRRAAEKEMMKPRKSPEIHRRIDISPSAFKKHSHLFEGMKSSGESSYKEDGKKSKSDSMDLRLDIERRKKQSSKERDHKREVARGSGDSPGSSRERSSEKFTKYHKKSKKSKKKRERSRSSSSSSSSSPSRSHRPGEYPHEEAEPREEGFNKARLGPREYGGPMERGRPRGGFQFRIRGRGWGRGNYPGNHSNGNPPNMGMPQHPKNEDWDPEYTPKSRKYYLHDDREGEVEKKWVDTRGRGRGGFVRGRGRFIFRKATAGSSSPKWTHDKFQGSGEEGELRDEDSEQDHKEEDKAAGSVGEQ